MRVPALFGMISLLGGCSPNESGPGTDTNDTLTSPSENGSGGTEGTDDSGSGGTETECGDAGACSSDELCVATRGALCMPLPDEGESCQPGCVLTEHCCNCTAFSCTPLPDECDQGADCGCVDDAQSNGFLELGCPADRSVCEEAGNPVLTCVLVDFDEDPFAEGGAPGAL